MSEGNGNKRKEWVKNAAIIFLSVLLVLTFFSNTIMNYSLPEVATQYVESGSITAKVRASGVVESGDPYSVKLKTVNDATATGVYDVDSVEVKAGDTVQKGDVLCHLTAGESKELEAAQEALNKQLLEYEIQILQGDASSSVLAHAQSGSTSSMSSYQSLIVAKEAEIKQLEEELEEAEDTLEAWKDEQGGTVSTKKEKQKLDAAKEAYDAVADVVDAAKEQIDAWQKEIDANDALIQDYEDGKLNSDGEPAVSEAEYTAAQTNNEILKKRIEEKKAEIAEDEAKLPALKKALDKAQSAYDNKASDKAEDIADEISDWTKEVSNRQKKLDEAKKEKDKLVSDIVNELSWSDTLADLREKIEKLKGEHVGGEVTAPISGSIISVYVKSGQETPGDGVLFTIQPEGKGYTMQVSVTNEQAKRLSVGDRAELVNSWRYDDVDVVLSSIKPDPQKPSQSKLLTFDVTGSVMDGQNLNISIGQRSANYDFTVPNSAIREDNNGKFILIVETKSTPLSNRYIATRVDVEVLASDDTRSAISAALYGYEYVITTSTAPVEAGKQVRLANN
ncbi:MAG: HlyD family efflux transporter periplasmic adaptor subunit [Lachnospiraceae bacterium]|nr:HlyD family efflux transporter periplasmic adaptor subunit [Lachnospiraceae bacterium]